VRRFEIDDLSDVVVIAGPNGVGKTRLIQSILDRLRGSQPQPGTAGVVVATCDDERQQWGKEALDLATAEDTQRLLATLSAGRRRRNWRSSLINFESDRTIQNLQPYPFAFDMPDPSEEQIGWDVTFTPLKTRFHDTVHAMYRMVESQRRSIATRAINLRREGKTSMQLEFLDPMEPFKDVFRQLLAPKELADLSMGDQRLQYLVDGTQLPFDSLSSGEREVVNIVFDFLLRGPRDCIVFFDEPELHLHPELSYKLVQVLQRIGENNQFIFATHSPDIITASLDRSVVFLAPANVEHPDAEPSNQAITVSESDETHQALKLLGQSIGIVALGRRIILVEGSASSLDKQTYGSILQQRYPDLVLVPSGGKHAIESFALVHEAVLSKVGVQGVS
jgi:ABC-type lipoprotein export system ATPase subunit